MKVPKINRKFILCAVLAVAIVGMFLVPAASVTAATQDWPLQLVGATTINVTQAEFEADNMRQAAVMYEMMVIGEATRRLSDEFRETHQ